MKKKLYAFGTSLYIQFDHKLENKIIEEIIKKSILLMMRCLYLKKIV